MASGRYVVGKARPGKICPPGFSARGAAAVASRGLTTIWDAPCFNVRIAPALHQRIARAAAHNGASLNRWVEQALTKAVNMR